MELLPTLQLLLEQYIVDPNHVYDIWECSLNPFYVKSASQLASHLDVGDSVIWQVG